MTERRPRLGRIGVALAGCVLLGGMAQGAAAPGIGQVQFSRGGVVAQQAADPARILGKGSDILLGDTLDTEADSFVVIHLDDATKITLRPSSRLAIEAFDATEGEEKALLRLERGGLQAQTGRIGSRSRDAFRLRTPYGMLRVQGARFNARLCDGDCAPEGAGDGAPVEGQPVAARIIELRGQAHAEVGADTHPLQKGSPLYSGDTVVTGGRSNLAMAFRDGGRISLIEETRFVIQKYAYQGTPGGAPGTGKASFRMLKGGLRAVTGFIGKGHEEDYELVTPVTTIGVRGTGFDSICRGDCLNEDTECGRRPDGSYDAGNYIRVWADEIVQRMPGGDYPLREGQADCVPNPHSPPVRLQEVPLFLQNPDAPRPDTLAADPQSLFSSETLDGQPAGVYVYVDDGFVALDDLELGRGEAGYGGAGGQIRFERPADFQLNDSAPPPWLSDDLMNSQHSLLKDDDTIITDFACKVK